MDKSNLEFEWLEAGKNKDLNKLKEISDVINNPYIIDDSGRTLLNIFLEEGDTDNLVTWLINDADYDPFYHTFNILKMFEDDFFREEMKTILDKFAEIYDKSESTDRPEIYDLAVLITDYFSRDEDLSESERENNINETVHELLRVYRPTVDNLFELSEKSEKTNLFDAIMKHIPSDMYAKIGRIMILNRYNKILDLYLESFKNKFTEEDLWYMLASAIETGDLDNIRRLIKMKANPNYNSLVPALLIFKNRISDTEKIRQMFNLLVQAGLELDPEILRFVEFFDENLQKALYLQRIKKMKEIGQKRLKRVTPVWETTDWMEICRSLDKQYRFEELKIIAQALGLSIPSDASKRYVCSLLASNFEEQTRIGPEGDHPELGKVKDRNCHNPPILNDDYDYLVDSQIVEFQEGGQKYCFSLEELEAIFKSDPNATNPYTRQVFPPKVKRYLERYQKTQEQKKIHTTKKRFAGSTKTSTQIKDILDKISQVYDYFPYDQVLNMTESDIFSFIEWLRRFVDINIDQRPIKRAFKLENREEVLLTFLKNFNERDYPYLGGWFDSYFQEVNENSETYIEDEYDEDFVL